jgi:hypothetical protein
MSGGILLLDGFFCAKASPAMNVAASARDTKTHKKDFFIKYSPFLVILYLEMLPDP